MLDIEKRIQVIEALLSEGSAAALTYAALECRLTIEYLCYERFKESYAYLSPHDLKGWQPKHVVKQVSDDISELSNRDFTLSVCKMEGDYNLPKNKQDYEKLEYKKIGTQKSLNLRKVDKLWHSLSKVSLHIPVPTIHSGQISIYGDVLEIKEKVVDVLNLLRDLAPANLIMGGVFGEVLSFNCVTCDTPIKKPKSILESGKVVISCISPDCPESYTIEKDGEGYSYERNVFEFKCGSCSSTLHVPHQTFANLRLNSILKIRCGGCTSETSVIMRPLVKCESAT
ncbi:TPA: hypothetical protein ACGF8R_003372 [Vibrio cholerae]